MDSRDSGFEVGPEMLAIAAAIPSITEASRIRVDPRGPGGVNIVGWHSS